MTSSWKAVARPMVAIAAMFILRSTLAWADDPSVQELQRELREMKRQMHEMQEKMERQEKLLEKLGAKCFARRPPDMKTFYETKFHGPDRVVFDITDHPWRGAAPLPTAEEAKAEARLLEETAR